MPTLDQIRAARALLNWSQSDLAERAGLSQTGIARIESGVNQPNLQTMERIAQAFDDAGIEFIADRGIERRDKGIRILRGQKGFIEFMDDVYQEISAYGGGDVCFKCG
jgi:transcriptional regulator with XRE-family HTH domain